MGGEGEKMPGKKTTKNRIVNQPEGRVGTLLSGLLFIREKGSGSAHHDVHGMLGF